MSVISGSRSATIPTIDYDRCQACPRCEAASHCRFKAIVRIDRDEPPSIDVSLCGGCGECAPYCPHDSVVPGSRPVDRTRP